MLSGHLGLELAVFQSTHSITECDSDISSHIGIITAFQSTHSITECDMGTLYRWWSACLHFNPRTPWPSASPRQDLLRLAMEFQSTHSITECDNRRLVSTWQRQLLFQSTHSITECDSSKDRTRRLFWLFQSTHSITECDQPTQKPRSKHRLWFQSTHSITECDVQERGGWRWRGKISIHALHYRVRLLSEHQGK